jgi:hypothetical protein
MGRESVVTFIVPTVGRRSLSRTLDSIECWKGDEILLVGDPTLGLQSLPMIRRRHEIRFIHCPRGNDWGHTERNYAAPFARCRYIAHIDDDDWYAPGTRALMADAIFRTPGRPIIFRMRFPNGITLWSEQEVRCGNVGTPMILIPNMPTRLGQFRPFVGGDFAYLDEAKWPKDQFVWRPEIIAHLDHDPGAPPSEYARGN